MTIIFFVLLLALVGFVYFASLRASQQAKRRRTQASRLALELHPAYQHKVAADRAYQLQREKQTAELELKRAEFGLKQYLALHRAPAGSYIINEETPHITALPSLNATRAEKEVAASAEPRYLQPSHEQLLSAIRPNSFTYSPGIDATTGEPVIVDLQKVPHLKIIGATGFGKSCLAASIIDGLITTHSPHVLQIALLDLEHKTSRLFEEAPHLCELQHGKRHIPMLATSADQVAEYLGVLKEHMEYRASLDPRALYKLPLILVYIEELLALQYEVVDPRLLAIIFSSLLVLTTRARKYGMFLLGCMQTDYSTEEMKVPQKMFRFRGAAGIDPSAARAAGFTNTELIKSNFQTGKPGHFVIEYPGFSGLCLSPVYDVERKLAEKFGYALGFGHVAEPETISTVQSITSPVQSPCNEPAPLLQTAATALQADLQKEQEILDLRQKGWGKVKILEKVYGVKAGSNAAYKAASAEYERIVADMEVQ